MVTVVRVVVGAVVVKVVVTVVCGAVSAADSGGCSLFPHPDSTAAQSSSPAAVILVFIAHPRMIYYYILYQIHVKNSMGIGIKRRKEINIILLSSDYATCNRIFAFTRIGAALS